MRFISEEQSAALVTHEIAFEAAREALVAAVADGTTLFPAVLGHGSAPTNRFSIKSASTAEYAGLKVGSFWPGNPDKGLPRHNSVILLFDQAVGRVDTVIEAGRVNAYRTAAADAVAASVLARPDSATLAVFGAGNQAEFEVRALARVLPIREVLVVTRDPANARALAERLAPEGLAVRAAEARAACEAADVIVTATPARAPLFEGEWVRPGTHVAGMGSDAKGKQELPVSLLERASLFCDLPAQAVLMGEYQHVAEAIAAGRLRIRAIGEVLAAGERGRSADDEITVFDSSGIALQDLTIARRILDLAGR
ncbi:ornithine cyclodeaminase family protein [Methylobacterium sp. A54F]